MDGVLNLAPGAKVSGEALATSVSGAVATSRARASLSATISSKRISARGAFLHRAVGSPPALVALASAHLVGIPGVVVLDLSVRVLAEEFPGAVLAVELGNLAEGLADTVAAAVIGARGTLASLAVVSGEALALAASPVADSAVRAFGHLRVVVVALDTSIPGSSVGASHLGAVGSLVGIHAVRAITEAGKARARVLLGRVGIVSECARETRGDLDVRNRGRGSGVLGSKVGAATAAIASVVALTAYSSNKERGDGEGDLHVFRCCSLCLR